MDQKPDDEEIAEEPLLPFASQAYSGRHLGRGGRSRRARVGGHGCLDGRLGQIEEVRVARTLDTHELPKLQRCPAHLAQFTNEAFDVSFR